MQYFKHTIKKIYKTCY